MPLHELDILCQAVGLYWKDQRRKEKYELRERDIYKVPKRYEKEGGGNGSWRVTIKGLSMLAFDHTPDDVTSGW